MREKWTGKLVGKMHVNEVSYADIGEKLGWTNHYVGMILNGRRSPSGAREKLETALDDLIRERKASK